jgi:hypothetical protein
MGVVVSEQERVMERRKTTKGTVGDLATTVALLALLPLAVAYPVVVVVIGVLYGALRSGRWFARALREADDRYRQLVPAYVRTRPHIARGSTRPG